MPRVVLAGSICQRAGRAGSISVTAQTAREAIGALEAACPELKGWVVDEQGALRRHVRLFHRGVSVTLEQALGPDEELHVVGAISGG